MSKGTILIAEDEEYTCSTLSFILENAGYHVVEARNSQEALYLILHREQSLYPIELLILDIEMSCFTGRELLHELRQNKILVPTIVITGLIDEQMLQCIQDNGYLKYLRKPFVPKEVLRCVSRMLQERKQLKESVCLPN
jgi:two-component system alkaline phosphatase synthesis response regulator PhoP